MRVTTWIDSFSGWVGRVISWALVAMIGAGALAAILRYLARPLGIAPALNALSDLQWMLFACVVLLGAAWALRDDGHVRVDVLAQRWSPRTRAWADLLGNALLLLPFCAFLLWALWPAVAHSVTVRETSLDPGGLARWPVKAMAPLAVALLALQGLAQIAKAAVVLRQRPGRDPGTESAPTPEAS